MPTLFYTIEDLGRGQTKESQEFNVLSTKDVDVVLVQYSYDSTGGLVPAQLEYTIGTQTIPVNGIYKSESTTIKFRNISAGTHKLVIHSKHQKNRHLVNQWRLKLK